MHSAAGISVFISQMQIGEWLGSVQVVKSSEVKILVTNVLVAHLTGCTSSFVCSFICLNVALERGITFSLLAPHRAVLYSSHRCSQANPSRGAQQQKKNKRQKGRRAVRRADRGEKDMGRCVFMGYAGPCQEAALRIKVSCAQRAALRSRPGHALGKLDKMCVCSVRFMDRPG